MNRLGLLYPPELDEEQKGVYDFISKFTGDKYEDRPFVTKLPDSRLIGPFGILLHTPVMGQAFMNMSKPLQSLPRGGLTPIGREIAIVVVGAKHKAAYELYAHCILAVRAGMSQEQVDAIVAGQKPKDMDKEGDVVYDIAWELANGTSVLSDELWKKGVDVIGKEGVTAVIHYVGFYAYVCTMLRGFDAKVPTDGEKEMERMGLI